MKLQLLQKSTASLLRLDHTGVDPLVAADITPAPTNIQTQSMSMTGDAVLTRNMSMTGDAVLTRNAATAPAHNAASKHKPRAVLSTQHPLNTLPLSTEMSQLTASSQHSGLRRVPSAPGAMHTRPTKLSPQSAAAELKNVI